MNYCYLSNIKHSSFKRNQLTKEKEHDPLYSKVMKCTPLSFENPTFYFRFPSFLASPTREGWPKYREYSLQISTVHNFFANE